MNAPSHTSRALLLAILIAAVFAAYANHFHNPFHFDDSHSIVDNPNIRSLSSVPRFFTDASTSSVLPANRSWRPLVTSSLAVDYRLANGLDPFWFQLSTFFWFLVEIGFLFLFAEHLFNSVEHRNSNRYAALLAAALYGLHPVCAETVNYISQRAEVYSTLGVLAGLYLYAARPGAGKYLLYLVPVAAALLSKPPALVFPALLFVYVYLFEEHTASRSLRAVLPSIALSVLFAILQKVMTPPTFFPGAASAAAYRLTQPWVALRYFGSFLLPVYLSADTDLRPLAGGDTLEAVAGFGFVLIVILAAWWWSRKGETKPAAFGLWWFLIALAPTSLFPLAEMENDHRMFFPFVGLAVAAAWVLQSLWRRYAHAIPRLIPIGAAVVLLAACGEGVHVRNQVWHSEESLWHDVTLKSPKNGRGLMNYGLTLMARGDMQGALDYFTRALQYTPAYDLLEVNLGIVTGAMHRDAEAERHFSQAITLAPRDAIPQFYYGRWLEQIGRRQEAIDHVRASLALNPDQPGAQQLLQSLLTAQSSVPAPASGSDRTPEQWLDLSLTYYKEQRYMESIAAAQTAIYLRPGYAEAYNNVGAAYAAMHLWEPAIKADLEAIKLKPDYQLARNNLAWALDQKRADRAKKSN